MFTPVAPQSGALTGSISIWYLYLWHPNSGCIQSGVASKSNVYTSDIYAEISQGNISVEVFRAVLWELNDFIAE